MTIEIEKIEKSTVRDGYLVHFVGGPVLGFRTIERMAKASKSHKLIDANYERDTDIKSAIAAIVARLQAGDSWSTVQRDNEKQKYTRPDVIREVVTRG